jgi:hypothetical protein
MEELAYAAQSKLTSSQRLAETYWQPQPLSGRLVPFASEAACPAARGCVTMRGDRLPDGSNTTQAHHLPCRTATRRTSATD